MIEPRYSIFNFKTNQYEWLDAPLDTLPDEQLENYCPTVFGMDTGARLYRLLREHKGMSKLDALLYVLSAGKSESEATDDSK